MVFYLVEVVMDDKLEVISLQCDWPSAKKLLEGRTGIISELNLDEVYPEGIGVCQHWHFPEEDDTGE